MTAPTDLTLFVSGASVVSVRAIAHARALCDMQAGGGYHLSVVDVHESAGAVTPTASGVLVTPTLVKNWPLPVRRFVGDLSQTDKVLTALGLLFAEEAHGQSVVA